MKRLHLAFICAVTLALAALLSTRAQTQPQTQPQAPPAAPSQVQARAAQPGAINYIEGQASIDGRPIGDNAVGTAELGRGQTLTTATGKVEVLLTPGVFLRIDDGSSVKMVDPRLEHTEVEVDRGRAMVEVTDISKDNDIQIDDNGATVTLLKTGVYEFDAAHEQVRVLDGEADVRNGTGKPVTVKKEREAELGQNIPLEASKFDTRNDEDDFFRWSALRSGYLSEATADAARAYVNGGPAWVGTGWYWDPWFDAYTFVPGDGVFYSPFGWGFYSPYALYRSPYYFYGHDGRPHRFDDFHYPGGHGVVPPGVFRGGGFHGGGAVRGGGHPAARPSAPRGPAGGRRR